MNQKKSSLHKNTLNDLSLAGGSQALCRVGKHREVIEAEFHLHLKIVSLRQYNEKERK